MSKKKTNRYYRFFNNKIFFILLPLLVVSMFFIGMNTEETRYVSVKGKEIVTADGKPILLKGTNLGNWLVPEGYMFKFKKTNSPERIHSAFVQLMGPEKAADFWGDYLDNYITHEDIKYLKKLGFNHLRVPFNYRMLTNEDYLGENEHGFEYLDRVIKWCQEEKLWVLLDMHCAPGGQTGDNIDDGYAYPFLFTSPKAQETFIEVWEDIADHYSNDTTVLGYDLMNEPIAHYFTDKDKKHLNSKLEPLYKRTVAAIREEDENHLIFLGGAQWNTNFSVFDKPFDDKLVYTFHKYWFDVKQEEVQAYLDFQKKYNVPIYMGESGENTDEWVNDFRTLLEDNKINWCFWPYKKMENTKGVMNFEQPKGYDAIIKFVEGDRSSFEAVRTSRPGIQQSEKVLKQFIQNSRYQNCFSNDGYNKALGLNPNSKVIN